MYDGSIEDLTLATLADYDRLVNRLLLESDARSAARTQTKRTKRSRLFPRVAFRRSTGSAI